MALRVIVALDDIGIGLDDIRACSLACFSFAVYPPPLAGEGGLAPLVLPDARLAPGTRIFKSLRFESGCSTGRRWSSTSALGALVTREARVLSSFVGTAKALFLRCGAKIELAFFFEPPVAPFLDRLPAGPAMIFGVSLARSDWIPSMAAFNFSASASNER